MSVLEQAIDVVQAVATGDDVSRLAARRHVRKERAAAAIAKQKYLALQERVRLLNAEADSAADAHREICEPTQDELAEVEADITNRMADRTEVPADLEAKRRELIDRIEVANEQLTEQVARFDRLRAPLNKAIREASKGAVPNEVFDGKLCSPELADRRLWNENFAQGEIVKALMGLMRFADSKINEAEELAAQSDKNRDPRNAKIYRSRCEKWLATKAAAEPLRREVEERASQLRAAMIDE